MIEPYYEAGPYFFQPFWEFQYRFQSLQRYWELNKRFIKSHVSALAELNNDGTAEFDVVYSETIEPDIEYFPEYLRNVTITTGLALIESLLSDICVEVAKEQGVEVLLDRRSIPLINKHILWLSRGCGIEISLSKGMNARLDAIRTVRNRFIHQINKEIPDKVNETISNMLEDNAGKDTGVTDDFVDKSIKQLAELAKDIENSYWNHENTK